MSSKRIVDLRGSRSQPRLPFFRAPEKRTSLRERRKKTRVVALLALCAVLATIAWAVHAFSYLPQLTVQRVVVTGTTRVPAPLIEAYVSGILDDDAFHFVARRNLFYYPKAAIVSAIPKNFPRVRTAALSRTALFDTTLVVTIAERVPYARWCIDAGDDVSSCFLMDESGYIFADSSDSTEIPTTSYIFSGGSRNVDQIGRTFAEGDFRNVITLLNALQEASYTPLGATLQSDGDFVVPLQSGYYLKVSHDGDALTVVRNLQLVLTSDALKGKESQLEYIDLRFGNRVYYRLTGSEETATQ